MPIQIVSICAHKIALFSADIGAKTVVFSGTDELRQDAAPTSVVAHGLEYDVC
jgi:hypothetical protein